MLLDNQLYANNRKGLGFGKTKLKRIEINDTAKGRSLFPKCLGYGRIRHSYDKCWYRNKNKNFKQIWVPKGTIVNLGELKHFWESKCHIINVMGL